MTLIKPIVASLEKKVANAPLIPYLYCLPYQQVVRREISLADITADDVVLNIGCGSVPFTAIFLAKLSGARVYAVDNDEEAVKKANIYLKKVGLEKQVTAIYQEGSHKLPMSFTAAVVALQAEPKKDILINLINNSQRGTRFVFREARKFVQNQYEDLPQGYQPLAKAQHKNQTFSSVLFVNQPLKGEENAS